MARPLRLQFSGAFYHITARGNERKDIFRSDDDRRAFLGILAHAIERYRLILHAYVLMRNHYHLLLETREASLSLAMRHLNGVYTSYFNRTHRRVGHLFQGRYKAILVEKESYLLELSRYIHLNPHRAKRAVGLGWYPWSSYRAFIGGVGCPGWLTRQEVLAYFGSNLERAQGAYERYVKEGIQKGVEGPWDKVIGQMVLGGEQFVERIRGRVGKGRDREVPARRHLESRPSWEAIQRAVGSLLPRLVDLRTGNRSNPERALMMYLGRERGGLSLKELAKRCEVEESTVSRIVDRVRQLRISHPAWDRALLKIERRLNANS